MNICAFFICYCKKCMYKYVWINLSHILNYFLKNLEMRSLDQFKVTFLFSVYSYQQKIWKCKLSRKKLDAFSILICTSLLSWIFWHIYCQFIFLPLQIVILWSLLDFWNWNIVDDFQCFAPCFWTPYHCKKESHPTPSSSLSTALVSPLSLLLLVNFFIWPDFETRYTGSTPLEF